MRATQHTMTNPRVDGDSARCRMYVEAWHMVDIGGTNEWCTIGAEYLDELIRCGGRWLTARLRLERRWTVGNPAVLDLSVA